LAPAALAASEAIAMMLALSEGNVTLSIVSFAIERSRGLASMIRLRMAKTRLCAC
jgi:hypothetical protein